MEHVKKSIQLLTLLVLMKIVLEVFEVSALPTMVSMTGIEAMMILDYILKMIFHPIFYVVVSLLALTYAISLWSKEKDHSKKVGYIKQFSSLTALLFFYALVPSLVDVLKRVTGN